MERSKAGMNKRSPDSLSHPNQNTIIIKQNMVIFLIFYKKWKKYNEIQLTKNKMDLNIQKITNHPPSPDWTIWNNPFSHRFISLLSDVIPLYKSWVFIMRMTHELQLRAIGTIFILETWNVQTLFLLP